MRDFTRGEILPSYFINREQSFIGPLATNFRVRALNDTTVQVVAGSGDAAATIGIMGRWRWSDVTVTRAMPGGGAGTFSVYVVAADNNVASVPQANTDNTNYLFDLRITTGAAPTIVAGTVDIYRLVATVEWDGTKITAVNPVVHNADNTISLTPTADRPQQTPLRVRGAASQTADLATFGIGTAAPLAGVTSAGQLYVPAAAGVKIGTGVTLTESHTNHLALPASNVLDLSAAGATDASTGAAAGDKIALSSGVGLGVQTNRMVAYVPSGQAFSVRAAAGSGQKSSGADVITLAATGAITATAGIAVGGALTGATTGAFSSNVTVGGTLTGMTNVTGTGSIVLAAGPTLTGTTTIATLSATTIAGGAGATTLTGTFAGTPTFSGAITFSSSISVGTTLGVTGVSTFANGTVSAPGIVFARESNSGLYSATTGPSFSYQGVLKATFGATLGFITAPVAHAGVVFGGIFMDTGATGSQINLTPTGTLARGIYHAPTWQPTNASLTTSFRGLEENLVISDASLASTDTISGAQHAVLGHVLASTTNQAAIGTGGVGSAGAVAGRFYVEGISSGTNGTILNAYGVYAGGGTFYGPVTNHMAFYAAGPARGTPTGGSAAVITNNYGLYVGDMGNTTNTSNYGVYIVAQTDNGTTAQAALRFAGASGTIRDGIMWDTSGANLYRSAAGTIKTDGAFTAVGNVISTGGWAQVGTVPGVPASPAAADIAAGGTLSAFQFDQSAAAVYFQRSDATTAGAQFWGRKARGTDQSSPAVVTAGDDLFLLRASGHDGAGFFEAARIHMQADPAGTITTGVIPGNIVFYTANSAGTITPRMTMDYAGLVTVSAKQALTPGNQTGLTAEAYSLMVTNPTLTFTTVGTIAAQRNAVFTQSTLNGAAGGTTITKAATVEISGAPAAGTNMTLTNAYALNVVAGLSHFGGAVTMDSTLAVTGTVTLTAALGIGSGGTGQTTATAAFDALSPMSAVGDLIYGGTAGTRTRLAPNTSATRAFLGMTGTGTVGAAPTWTSSTGTGNVVLTTAPAIAAPAITGASTITDAGSFVSAADTTKKVTFDLSAMTTAITTTLTISSTAARTITLPNATTTLAGLAVAQTFTGIQSIDTGAAVGSIVFKVGQSMQVGSGFTTSATATINGPNNNVYFSFGQAAGTMAANGYLNLYTGPTLWVYTDSSGTTNAAISAGPVGANSATAAVNMYAANPSNASYTGNSFLSNVTRAAATTFNHYSATANGVQGFYVRGDGAIFSATPAGGGTAISSVSDARLKKNVVARSGALDRISALRPVDFVWNERSSRPGVPDYGFIAQEVQGVLPNAVLEMNVDGEDWLTVSNTAFIPDLIGAVQNVDERLRAVESKLALIA